MQRAIGHRSWEMQVTDIPYSTALIVGAGPGISASVARQLAAAGLKVAIAARDTAKLEPLVAETGANAFAVDAADARSVAALFERVEAQIGIPQVVLYNASGRLRGSIVDLDPDSVREAIAVSAYGGFLVTQQAAKRLVPIAWYEMVWPKVQPGP